MIKAIIFDFGGVCFYPGTSNQLLKEALLNSDLPKIKIISLILNQKKRAEIKKCVDIFNAGKISEEKFWLKIKKITKYNFDENKIKKLIISLNKPIKETIDVLKKLKKKYKLGLLTNNNSWLEEIDKKYKFSKYFDVIVNSYDVKTIKPNKKIYYIILEKLQLDPEECIFIDDQKENVKAAREIGMNAIIYRNAGHLLKQLRNYGVEI